MTVWVPSGDATSFCLEHVAVVGADSVCESGSRDLIQGDRKIVLPSLSILHA